MVYIVIKDKSFYDFENKDFTSEFNNNCQTENRTDTDCFLDALNCTIMHFKKRITNIEIIEGE